ncbi:hypothetical protein PRIPAC_72459 [Pristionchus pacificus]|uniref:Uncharacterized protein n=1 Tax=Pristionchus pacificus TaxID=54126 RepID=A0A2A6C741_PRIPA|nr:hypothetical protein PRIPAC_72459 [Pristionchus pacificus]|eukprot:PDM73841.1 hypothetical protein PRIPAC_41197 [Pristionchus pacificus]
MDYGAYVSPLLHSFDQLEAKYSAKDDVGAVQGTSHALGGAPTGDGGGGGGGAPSMADDADDS